MAFPTTSLEMRYEAKDESSYSDGNEATTVTDQSGNSRDLTGSGLTWQSGVLNGHAVYRLDGQDDSAFRSTGGQGISQASLSAVVKAAANTTSRTWPTVGLESGTDEILAFTCGETSSEWGCFVRSSTATAKVFTSGVDETQWTHLLVTWDGATVTLYRDGTQVGTDGLDTGSMSLDGIKMGTLAALGEYFGGDVALMATWSKALDSTERSDLQTYVETTYFTTPLYVSVDDDPASPTDTDWINNGVPV